MRIKFIIGIFIFIVSPGTWGQEKGFESGKLRQAASELSKEYPYVDIVYQFTEKYLDQLISLPQSERDIKMRQDGFRIEEGNLKFLRHVNDETGLTVQTQANHYIVGFTNGETSLIRVSFPMSYQLITGKTLKELEAEFIKELTNWRRPASLPPDKVLQSEMKQTAPGMYIRKGTAYYIEEIHNHLYYAEKNNQIELVYAPEHIAESFFNLMISENISCDMDLKLIIRQYGFKTSEIRVPLKQWISYCKSKGCNLYVGIEKMETDKLSGCVFIVNEPFKYNHVMNVKFPYSLLDVKKGTIEANVMVFIPTYNLLSLFDEFDMYNIKTK